MNLKSLKDLDKDEILSMLGLSTRRSTAGWVSGTLGVFGVGMLAGAGIGLMLAPKTGRELRGDVRHRLQRVPEEIGDAVHRITGNDPHPSAVSATKV
jgi:hypothetical protein